MDVGFDIDTTGDVSNFTINDFITAPYNEQFKEDLFELAILRIKDKPFWPTGKILGQRVRTKHNVRVSFGEIGKENKHFLEIDSLDSNKKK
mgnify:CR=1 FL=1